MKQITTLKQAAEAIVNGECVCNKDGDQSFAIEIVEAAIRDGQLFTKPEEITLYEYKLDAGGRQWTVQNDFININYTGRKVTGTVEDIQEQDKT